MAEVGRLKAVEQVRIKKLAVDKQLAMDEIKKEREQVRSMIEGLKGRDRAR